MYVNINCVSLSKIKMMRKKHIVIFIITILLIVVYFQYAFRVSQNINIIQLNLEKINLDILYEKNPSVIYDRVMDPSDLLKNLFAYNYISAKDILVSFQEGNIIKNMHKYAGLYNELANVEINIFHPSNIINESCTFQDLGPEAQYITIKLKKNQLLILPMFWLYHCTYPLQTLQIHDIFSRFFGFASNIF